MIISVMIYFIQFQMRFAIIMIARCTLLITADKLTNLNNKQRKKSKLVNIIST